MRTRLFGALIATAAAGLLGAGTDLRAQSPAENPDRACPMVQNYPAFHRCAIEKMKTFTPQMTPWGRPDLRGIWRPTRIAQDIEEVKPGMYGNFGHMYPLVVEPATNKFPYNPWAMKQRYLNEQIYLSPTAVCLPVAQPRWSYSPVSITGHRITQSDDLITFSMERLHTYRMIHLDDRPRLPENMHLWQGDSRGRWEGNTLVITTTNLNDLMWMDHIGTFLSPALETVERISLVDHNTLHYEQTMTDPNVFTEPVKIAIAFLRATPGDPMDDMDLEDTSVENCEFELKHMMNIGQVPFPGYEAVAPKE